MPVLPQSLAILYTWLPVSLNAEKAPKGITFGKFTCHLRSIETGKQGLSIHMAMKRICYMSRSMTGLTREDFDSIVSASKRNNRDDNITGLLLYDERRFLQAIEGSAEYTDACFRRICADDRHRDISVFQDDYIERREFGTWSLRTRSAFDINAYEFKSMVLDDTQAVRSTKLRAMFIGFASMVRC